MVKEFHPFIFMTMNNLAFYFIDLNCSFYFRGHIICAYIFHCNLVILLCSAHKMFMLLRIYINFYWNKVWSDWIYNSIVSSGFLNFGKPDMLIKSYINFHTSSWKLLHDSIICFMFRTKYLTYTKWYVLNTWYTSIWTLNRVQTINYIKHNNYDANRRRYSIITTEKLTADG